MLSMYAKCLTKCRRGTHFASILPRRPSFSVRIPQIMHSGQILPLFFDLSFVRELCDSCLRGSSGRDQHRGSTFTGILACPLREGANAVARPFVGVLASWFVLRWGVSAAVRSLCRNVSGQRKNARRRKAPSLARPSRSAFLSGKSWHYFVAMHSRKGASVRQRKATGRGTPSRTRRRLRGR